MTKPPAASGCAAPASLMSSWPVVVTVMASGVASGAGAPVAGVPSKPHVDRNFEPGDAIQQQTGLRGMRGWG